MNKNQCKINHLKSKEKVCLNTWMPPVDTIMNCAKLSLNKLAKNHLEK